MAHIIRSGIHGIAVPEGLPQMACEVVDGALVRAWLEDSIKPSLSWEAFTRLPVRPAGTAFQQAVWRALMQVPFGRLVSYGQLARMAGHPKAVRAVGQAVGANPILWRIPCHRVVRSDGRLGGFSCGLAVKRAFLKYEDILIFENSDIIFSFKNNQMKF